MRFNIPAQGANTPQIRNCTRPLHGGEPAKPGATGRRSRGLDAAYNERLRNVEREQCHRRDAQEV